MDNFNHLSPEENLQIETLYQDYLLNPNSVDDNWRVFFEGYEFAQLNPPSVSPSDISSPETNFQKEFKVVNLINGYRNRGHLFTKTNPVRERRQYLPTLALENFGLNNSDLESVFQAGSLIGIGTAKLKDIIAYLLLTYCESVGAEYKYIRTPEVVDWLEQKMERAHNSKTFSSIT